MSLRNRRELLERDGEVVEIVGQYALHNINTWRGGATAIPPVMAQVVLDDGSGVLLGFRPEAELAALRGEQVTARGLVDASPSTGPEGAESMRPTGPVLCAVESIMPIPARRDDSVDGVPLSSWEAIWERHGDVVRIAGVYRVSSTKPYPNVRLELDGSVTKTFNRVRLRLDDGTLVILGIRPEPEITALDNQRVVAVGRMHSVLSMARGMNQETPSPWLYRIESIVRDPDAGPGAPV